MDVITLIWYSATLLVLIAFCVVFACADSKYCRSPRSATETEEVPPLSPAPSYRAFAPPSYDTVMKKYKNRIFIVPVHEIETKDINNNIAVDLAITNNIN